MTPVTSKPRGKHEIVATDANRPANAISPTSAHWKFTLALALIIAGFVILQLFLPLRTAVQIGADEGFELAKATLCLKGYRLYAEVWNDQPPLHTWLITQILKHVSASILGPRLVTSIFTAILLASIFFIAARIHGLPVAAVTAALLIASPGFVELSSSCMLEIPALALAVAALCVLYVVRQTKWRLAEILAGILLGLAFQIKLVNAILLPLAALIAWQRCRNAASPRRRGATTLLVLAGSLAFSFVVSDYAVDGGAYLLHFKQSWTSHFAATKSFEYGSPDEHPFDWSVPLKNWDTTLPAVLGVVFLARQWRKTPPAIIPLAWLALTLIVFAIHKPWWPYYYIHIAIPLCWSAALGIEAIHRRLRSRRNIGLGMLFGVYGICALGWLGTRVYLQVANIRNSPQTFSSPVLNVIGRLKPFAKFIYCDEPIYSFYAGVPMPPDLAVMPLKRLWSGEMTNARLTAEMSEIKPEIIFLKNDARDIPFGELIVNEYRLVYEDAEHRLYTRKTLARNAGF